MGKVGVRMGDLARENDFASLPVALTMGKVPSLRNPPCPKRPTEHRKSASPHPHLTQNRHDLGKRCGGNE